MLRRLEGLSDTALRRGVVCCDPQDTAIVSATITLSVLQS